jgi:2-C-methyl-D-erythritol 2,4-cyclodiphosphate synthase
MKPPRVVIMNKQLMETIRIGFGYDVHRIVNQRRLILGGVHIHSDFGLLGHSDADVLLHAICDALLGAVALGDIGKHFPDSDRKYRNISSIKLLKQVGTLLHKYNYRIGNIDSTIILERPKISRYINRMRQRIGDSLNISTRLISIKATTHEGLGPFGKGEGCAAFAVALVIPISRM